MSTANSAGNDWRHVGDETDVRRAVFRLRASSRKCWLFGVACCRLVAEDIRHPDCLALIDLVEKRADDDSLAAEVTKLRRRVSRWAGPPEPNTPDREWHARFAAWAAAEPRPRAPHPEFLMRLRGFRDFLGEVYGPREGGVTFDPAWRTDTAVSLAKLMYESRDYSAMPILADALQDAGCEHPDILNHCREPAAPHVRGCWVVDLVLGKE